MFQRSADRVLNRCRSAKQIAVVGAGRTGRALLAFLLDNDISVEAVFDNRSKGEGVNLYGISVSAPYAFESDDSLYIISVISEGARSELIEQLKTLGVKEDEIVCYFPNRSRTYHRTVPEEEIQDEISAMYFEHFQKEMSWEHPATYNEIINIEKLRVQDPRRTRYADKVLVREWVADKIGKQYLVPQYGVWDNANDIDFDSLPERYVLKANNGSVRNIIVKDASQLDRQKAVSELNAALSDNFAFQSFEMHYKDISPRIICEEYLEGVADSVYEYDIFCFRGEPKYIWCIKGSHKPDCKGSFYDLDWKLQPFSYGYPYDEVPAPKPGGLQEMLRLSRILSKEFHHVRVDWYDLPDGRVLFGEMTFSTWGGIMHFVPEKYDRHFGELVLEGWSL